MDRIEKLRDRAFSPNRFGGDIEFYSLFYQEYDRLANLLESVGGIHLEAYTNSAFLEKASLAPFANELRERTGKEVKVLWAEAGASPVPVSSFGSCHGFQHFQGHFILAGSVLDKTRIFLKHKIAHPTHFFSGASSNMRRQNAIFQHE